MIIQDIFSASGVVEDLSLQSTDADPLALRPPQQSHWLKILLSCSAPRTRPPQLSQPSLEAAAEQSYVGGETSQNRRAQPGKSARAAVVLEREEPPPARPIGPAAKTARQQVSWYFQKNTTLFVMDHSHSHLEGIVGPQTMKNACNAIYQDKMKMLQTIVNQSDVILLRIFMVIEKK